MGHDDVHRFLASFLDAPTTSAISEALSNLRQMGALDRKLELTPLGWHLSHIPADVKTAKLLVFGAMFCCVDPISTIAACAVRRYWRAWVSPLSTFVTGIQVAVCSTV